MSEKTKLNDCLFSIEVKGDDVSINVEGKARDLAETIANAAIHSDEVNTVLKLATMLLVNYEMEQDDEDETQTPVFGGVMGQA
jgi:hypothetical protein